MRRTKYDPAGKIALVTGGGGGIGRGIALALARRGAHVVVVGRGGEALLATAATIMALGVRGLPIPMDITDPAARPRLIAAVKAELGGLDVLVHSAGVLNGGPLAARTAMDVECTIATNLTAAIDLTRLAQPELEHRRGALVCVGSAMAFVPMPNATLYAASKAGLHGFVQACRYELEPAGVRVLAAYPPGTDTALLAGVSQRASQDRSALGRLGRAVLPAYRLHDPAAVGEHIVASLVAGRRTLLWGGERWLVALHKVAPGLVERALRQARGRFAW